MSVQPLESQSRRGEEVKDRPSPLESLLVLPRFYLFLLRPPLFFFLCFPHPSFLILATPIEQSVPVKVPSASYCQPFQLTKSSLPPQLLQLPELPQLLHLIISLKQSVPAQVIPPARSSCQFPIRASHCLGPRTPEGASPYRSDLCPNHRFLEISDNDRFYW